MFEVSREIAGPEKRKSTDLVSNRCHHKRNSNPAHSAPPHSLALTQQQNEI